MSEVFEYRTLSALSEGIYKEKGSKFICYAAPCFSEDEAKELLHNWRKDHHQARHLCFAYRFGADMKVFRANDDGEPSNSAGMPILGQIKSYELTNVLVGVVRYFGGTKLGVGGLINAYKEAAKDAIDNGTIITREIGLHVTLCFQYDKMSEVMNLIKRLDLSTRASSFEDDCKLEIIVPQRRSDEVIPQIMEIEGIVVTKEYFE